MRQLERSTDKVHHIQGISEPQLLKPILAGILCYESAWSPPFGEPFRKHLTDHSGLHQLNIGCSLCRGTFEVPYPEDSRGYPDISTSPVIIIEDRWPLLQFLLRLLKQLQPLGTAPAINYPSYLACLHS